MTNVPSFLHKPIGFVVELGVISIILGSTLGFDSLIANIIFSVYVIIRIVFVVLGFLPKSDKTHGSADWASVREMKRAGLYAETGIVVGRLKKKMLRYNGDGHLMTIAPTRSGKGVSAIIPNLLTYPGSVMVIDPKGENAAVTARARLEMGQSVHVLDPWQITDLGGARFNPMSWLDPNSLDFADDAALIADSLIYDAPGATGEAHWNEEAKALLTGVIMHAAAGGLGRRDLLAVREAITRPPKAFVELLKDMSESGGLIARAAARHEQKSDKEASGVLSSAQRHTHFLDSPRMAAVLDGSDFDPGELKTSALSVYLVLPAERIPTYGRWLRIMVQLTMTALARTPGKPKKPVLFILDELAALGYLQAVEQGFGLMAGYGVQLWPFIQDMSQLKVTYPKWESFFANTAVFQTFGVADQNTAKYVSDLLGENTVTYEEKNQSQQEMSLNGSTGQSSGRTARALLKPDEVRKLPMQLQILFLRGRSPILAEKIVYYSDPALSKLADQNPMLNAAVSA